MSRLSMIYDGKVADDLTSDELIESILKEYDVAPEENTIRAMNEIFRCGFLHGEDYSNSLK